MRAKHTQPKETVKNLFAILLQTVLALPWHSALAAGPARAVAIAMGARSCAATRKGVHTPIKRMAIPPTLLTLYLSPISYHRRTVTHIARCAAQDGCLHKDNGV